MRKIIPFLCVFMYFMSPYRLGGHQMPEIIGLLAVALALILGFRVQFEKSYLLFVAYMWIVPPMIGIACGILGNYRQALIPVGLILSTLYIGFLPLNIKKDYVLKYYKLLVYLAIAFFVIQELSYNVTGHRPTLYLTFLETYYEDIDAVLFALSRAGLDRSSSFFLEPSHFAQYIIPYFCIIVSKYAKEKTGLKEVIIVFLIIIWIRSGVGYVSLLAIAGFFFLKSDVMKINQRIMIVLIAFVGFMLTTTVYADNELVAYSLNRLSEFSMEIEASGAQSGFIRIWRGYFIYGAMDIVNQIFGVSVAGVESVSSSVYIPDCRYDGTYLNGIQSLLVIGGLVGLFLFINYLFRIYKKMDIAGQSILVSMITVFFLENMLYTSKMFLYILLALCFMRNSVNYKLIK